MSITIAFKVSKRDTVLLRALTGFYAASIFLREEKNYNYLIATFSSKKQLNAVLAYCKDNHMDVTIVEEKEETK